MNIIQAGQVAVDELIKVAKEPIVDSEDDISADRLKNAAATKKLAIFDAFEILKRIQEEKDMLEDKPKKDDDRETVDLFMDDLQNMTSDKKDVTMDKIDESKYILFEDLN